MYVCMYVELECNLIGMHVYAVDLLGTQFLYNVQIYDVYVYVCKALYRVNEFEFSRLSQQYWWKLVGEVAVTMSSQPLLDRCECIYVCMFMYVCMPIYIYVSLYLYVHMNVTFLNILAALINHTAPH